MSGDGFFWTFFGAIWLVVGLMAALGSLSSLLTGVPPPSDPDLRWVFLAVGTLASGAGGAIVARARIAAARVRRLMDVGIELAATVIAIRSSAIRVNRHWLWCVRYRYEYAAGSAFEGESGALPADAVETFKPSDRVRIKVDPLRPQDSMFLGRA